jgi:ketol-acid reductoisomerase
MRRMLEDIQNGAFSREWLSESGAGMKQLQKLFHEQDDHPIEEVGQRLRALMPWLDEV